MKFNMNRTWNDAMSLVRKNREVLAIVAGVFFLLPGLVINIIFADEQTAAMAMLQQALAGNVEQRLAANVSAEPSALYLVLGLLAFVIQMVGYLALLALMDDRQRPTVGEAIATAFKSLPSLIGAFLLFVVGYALLILALSLVSGLLIGAASLSGSTVLSGGMGVIAVAAILVVIVYVMTRISLVLPEIVLGATRNPVAAFIHSWKLTKSHAARLFGFYMLLLALYLVLSILLFSLVSVTSAVSADSDVGIFVFSLISGVVGAFVSVVMMAIIAAIYRQLAGPSAGAVSETFE